MLYYSHNVNEDRLFNFPRLECGENSSSPDEVRFLKHYAVETFINKRVSYLHNWESLQIKIGHLNFFYFILYSFSTKHIPIRAVFPKLPSMIRLILDTYKIGVDQISPQHTLLLLL